MQESENLVFAFRGARNTVTTGAEFQVSSISSPLQSLGWADELHSISLHVPAFAIWQISTLEQCFRRYCNILQVAGRDVRFRRNCIPLMANAERISENLESVRATRQWPAFNRAAFELTQDCEQLASLVANAC